MAMDIVDNEKSPAQTVSDYFRRRDRAGKPSPAATPTPEPDSDTVEPTPTPTPSGSPAQRAVSDYFKRK